MARIADSSFIDDSIGVFIDNINQISVFLGNLDSVDHSPLVTSENFNNRVNDPANTFYDPRDVPPLTHDAVREVNFLHNKVQYFSYLLFSSLPPNMGPHKLVADSAYFDNLTVDQLIVPIPQHRLPPPGYVGPGDSAPGDSDYPHTGLLAIDSANISYLSGQYFKVGANYFDSPHAGYYSLLNNPSYNAGTGKVWFDSSENLDFGLVLNTGRINKLTGPPADADPPFPFPMPRRSNVDSGFEQDSGFFSYDSGRFNQLMVGNFFIADSTPTIDSSDFQQFRFPNDSNNFTSLEFNSLHFDSDDTFNLPLRRVQRLTIKTDSGVFNGGGFLLTPWDSASRIT
jgi:hypothetical protein|tara:strand:+ start:882 stop:1904 length:1023 start_codon:yes stop_codon:yes gene_type:complete